MVDLEVLGGLTTTTKFIARHAKQHPQNVAVIDQDKKITYHELSQDLCRFIHTVQGFDLKVGRIAGIEWTSLYNHLLLVFAFETVGVATFSFLKSSLGEYQSLIDDAALILTTDKSIGPADGQVEVITESWFDKIRGQDLDFGFPFKKITPDTPVRVHLTSGTTGTPKRITLTAKIEEFRYAVLMHEKSYSHQTKLMVNYPFSVHAMYCNVVACIRRGGTCIYKTTNFIPAILDYQVTNMSVLPIFLKSLLNALPPDYVKPKNLTVATLGSHLPDDLRARALDKFATRIVEFYGTNETGAICQMNRDSTGTVLPGVQVEIVDENHRVLDGGVGSVRIKSNGCIALYEDDPTATERMFKEGWFYPGDIGTMTEAKTLKLLGRADDLINIGGVKLAPEKLEAELYQLAPVDDLCITVIKNSRETDRVCIAVVLEASISFEKFNKIIAPKLSAFAGQVSIVEVNKIPRTSTGKAQRKLLNKVVQEILD